MGSGGVTHSDDEFPPAPEVECYRRDVGSEGFGCGDLPDRDPTWGSPRIQAELAKLGHRVSAATVRKYRPKGERGPPSQTWRAFLRNHTEQLIAVDFFTVPTITCRVLFVFVVLAHERRKVLHFAVTGAPSAAWAGQQIVNSFPFETPPKCLLRDRDDTYGAEFIKRVTVLGIEEKPTARHAPRQNPYVERLIGNIRRECLDRVLVIANATSRKSSRTTSSTITTLVTSIVDAGQPGSAASAGSRTRERGRVSSGWRPAPPLRASGA